MDGLENCIRDSAKVIGVDEHDCQIGVVDKRDAHRSGSPLHRAVSIFIFNEKGEVLVQQRSMEKEIAPGMWSNTCCAHPRPGQDTLEAAIENLKFEAGIVCSLKEVCTMRLSEDLGNGNAWNEMDHIFVGRYYENPIPNPHEVGKMQWIPINELRQDMSTRPERYSGVLKNALEIAVKFDQAQMVGKIRAKAKNM